MKKRMLSRLFVLVAVLLMPALQASAQKEFYGVTNNGGETYTYYYDTQKESRGGTASPGDGLHISMNVVKVVFDSSVADYTPISMTGWFQNCSLLTTIEGLEYLNTSNVWMMNAMFFGCSSLTSLDLSHFDTSNVTTMFGMFENCTSLTSVNLTSFDTSKVTSMEGMFAFCSSLKSLDLSSFNTAKVGNMSGMFAYCEKLKTIYADESRWSTAAIENNDNSMFSECMAPLTGGNGTSFWDTYYADDASYARIDKAGQPGYLTHKAGPAEPDPEPYAVLSDNNTVLTFYYDGKKSKRGGMSVGPFNINNIYSSRWGGHSADITTVVFDATMANCTSITSTEYWFFDCSKLQSITGLDNLRTDNVTNMSYMFHQCTSLTAIDLSGFKTDKVVTMANMFDSCSGLKSLDLSEFNTSKVTDMAFMFYYCTSLTSLDLSHFDTSNVTTMSTMFDYCTSLTSVNLTGFDTSKVTLMDGMFGHCPALTSLDLSSFNTAKVGNMSGMFAYCSKLETIYVDESKWSTAALTNSNNSMFVECMAPLTGGNGTSYWTTYCADDASYARIDKDGQPGYLTHKAGTVIGNAEPYAVLSSDSKTVTFYYDAMKETRGGIEINNSFSYVNYSYNNVTNAVIDKSMENYRPTSTSCWFQSCSNLTSITGMQYLNTSEVTDMSHMFYKCEKLTSLDVSHFNTSKVTTMYWMFHSCSSLTSLDVSGFNTDNVTNMCYLFYGCSGLTNLDVSGFNTDNVTNMIGMFSGCSGLTMLDVSKFNTSNVTNMVSMFSGCSGLTMLDVSKFNTSNVTNMGSMFSDCSGLTTLDVSGFKTPNLTTMEKMFINCKNLKSLDLSNFNTEKVSYMVKLFSGCSSLTSIDLSSFNTAKVTNMNFMFNECSNLKTIYVGSGWTTAEVTSSSSMFFKCVNIVGGAGTVYDATKVTDVYAHIDGGQDDPGYLTDKSALVVSEPYAVLSNDNTILTFYYDGKKEERGGMDVGPFTYTQSSVNSEWYSQNKNITRVVFDKSFADCTTITSTAYWFYHCYNITTIEGLENLNTSQVTDMNHMFFNCHSLTSLDLSNFNTASVADMSHMFWQCSQLTTLDVSSFDTSKVTDMSYMFSYCYGLTSLDLSNFNTPELTRAGSMFSNCLSLTTLNMGNLNTEKVTDMSYMFSYCTYLTTIDVTSFNTSNVIRLDYMFQNCSSLKSIDVNSFDVSKVSEMEYMFDGCSNLTTILCNNTWSCENSWRMFSGCSLLKGAIDYDGNKIDGTYANPTTGYFTAKVIETKCATPVIHYANGELSFSCETEGVEFVYSYSAPAVSVPETVGGKVKLPMTYTVTVFARKEGLEDSEKVSREIDASGIKGDIDGDGKVTITDAVGVVNLILDGEQP